MQEDRWRDTKSKDHQHKTCCKTSYGCVFEQGLLFATWLQKYTFLANYQIFYDKIINI